MPACPGPGRGHGGDGPFAPVRRSGAVLVLGRRVGEGVMIGHDIKVTVIVIAGDKVRIGIDAPAEVEVHREEVYLEIQEANRRAAGASADAVRELSPALRQRVPGRRSPGRPPGSGRPAGGQAPGGAQSSERPSSGSAAR